MVYRYIIFFMAQPDEADSSGIDLQSRKAKTGGYMNKVLGYMFVAGTLLNGYVLQLSAEDDKDVVNVRMAFIGGDANNRGVVLQLEEENLEPKVGEIEETVLTKVRKRTITEKIKKKIALDAYQTILSPLIQGDTITITKQTIEACKANLKDTNKFAKIMAYFKGDEQEMVRKDLTEALDKFYNKIRGPLLSKSSGIDFDSLTSSGGSSGNTANQSTGANKYPKLEKFFGKVLKDVDSDNSFDWVIKDFESRNYTPQTSSFSSVSNPFMPQDKITRQNLLQEWNTLSSALTTQGKCPASENMSVIEMVPFVDIYQRENMVTRPLRLVYGALIELGSAFKFQLDAMDPTILEQSYDRARGIVNWLRSSRGKGSQQSSSGWAPSSETFK